MELGASEVNQVGLRGYACLKCEMKQVTERGGDSNRQHSVGAMRPQPGLCASSARKLGLSGLTRTARVEEAPHDIRVKPSSRVLDEYNWAGVRQRHNVLCARANLTELVLG
jgi:hypothetical protein